MEGAEGDEGGRGGGGGRRGRERGQGGGGEKLPQFLKSTFPNTLWRKLQIKFHHERCTQEELKCPKFEMSNLNNTSFF